MASLVAKTAKTKMAARASTRGLARTAGTTDTYPVRRVRKVVGPTVRAGSEASSVARPYMAR